MIYFTKNCTFCDSIIVLRTVEIIRAHLNAILVSHKCVLCGSKRVELPYLEDSGRLLCVHYMI
jgi:hypothetical protein